MEVVRLFFGSFTGFLSPAMPFNGYAIKHPQGVVLVDTGFGIVFGDTGRAGVFTAVREGEQVSWPWHRRHTFEALADHNIDPHDVKYVINTHLGDHSGDNRDFPWATFILQQPEIDWIRSTLPPDQVRRAGWDFPGAKIHALQGEDTEILPGVNCVFTPGHTPGHQSVLVDEGKQLFVGDAAYTVRIFTHPEEMTPEHPAWHAQGANEGWTESVEKLRRLDADILHFAHDPDVYRPPR
jgi:glyoxylase-like metal-dependent hydrolase (beta-lactamase superfamily II)